MNKSFFQEFHSKKDKLIALAERAVQNGWITQEEQNEICDKINTDTLTIGVIGQMKCGKSTFLNAFVFGENVLPVAATPMTAALSVITYGENKKIVAEFYTAAEWQEQQEMASRSVEDANDILKSKIQVAKELVSNAKRLGESLHSYLGTTKEDEFDSLIEYVGADGKYVPITKSVTIYYPNEDLKGVEIVDTPGFNDPIVSREERTKAFLKKADVVLVMLYAGCPFNTMDREIIFRHVRQCGIGKVIIGINKYDIPYSNGDCVDEIKDYVKQEINKECRECGDDTLNDIVKQTEPILLSAQMALLSQLSMDTIRCDEVFWFDWNRYCKDFEIASQAEMFEKSNLGNLTAAIKQLIETEKEQILFTKPLNALKAAANNKLESIERELCVAKARVANLSMQDEAIDEKEMKLNTAKRRINRKIQSCEDVIKTLLVEHENKGIAQWTQAIAFACQKMNSIVNQWGLFDRKTDVESRLRGELQRLRLDLYNEITVMVQKLVPEITDVLNDYYGDIEEVCLRYIEDMDDAHTFVTKEKRKITESLYDGLRESRLTIETWVGKKTDTLTTIFDNVFVVGVTTHIFAKRTLANGILAMQQTHSDVVNFAAQLLKFPIIDIIRNDFITQLIDPLQQQIEEISQTIENREEQAQQAREQVEVLKKSKEVITEQLSEFAFDN